MTEKLYSDLLRLAKKRLSRAGDALRYVSISDPEDLVHGFVASTYFEDSSPAAYCVHDFSEYCSDVVRVGARRRDVGTIITNSQNFAADGQDSGYRDDDLVDSYIYRNSERFTPVNPSLSDGPCRDSSGRVDYDLMLEDVMKEMCKEDRLFCVKNHRTGQIFQCGNVRAIPLELMYAEGA